MIETLNSALISVVEIPVEENRGGQVNRVMRNDFLQFRYPDSYKREISITKFERDVHVNGGYVTSHLTWLPIDSLMHSQFQLITLDLDMKTPIL